MRILLLSQWFEPEPTLKGLTFARALAARGHDVEALTGFPNYPGGVLYPGYKPRIWQRETMQGIPVTRVALYPSHDKSPLRRALNYTSFGVTSALLGSALVRKPDVIYVYHPPATTGLAALIGKLFRGVPFVYDVQDLWPDTLAVSGMAPGRLVPLLDWWCKTLYRHAAAVTVLSPGFKRLLVARGVSENKIEVIYNWCDETFVCEPESREVLAARLGLKNRFNVVFAGNMGSGQALGAVLDAARLCASKCPLVQFIFIGDGIEREHLQRRATEQQLANVCFLPRQPMHMMRPLLRLADVLLVHLKDEPLFRITIPSKTQAYMAAGRPILMAVPGDSADLVRSAGAGIVCEPENPEDIARAVHRFVDMPPEVRVAMGESGAQFYHSHLRLSVGVENFERVFERARCRRGE